jgi:hypothetical protein
MAIVSESKKKSSCSGRKRPNPNKGKTVRKAELKSKLVKLSDRRGFIGRAQGSSLFESWENRQARERIPETLPLSRDGQGTDDAVFTRNVNPSKAI